MYKDIFVCRVYMLSLKSNHIIEDRFKLFYGKKIVKRLKWSELNLILIYKVFGVRSRRYLTVYTVDKIVIQNRM